MHPSHPARRRLCTAAFSSSMSCSFLRSTPRNGSSRTSRSRPTPRCIRTRDPVDQLARRRALAQARHRAQLVERDDRLVDERVVDARVVHAHDALHQLLIGEVDEVEDAAAKERVRQLLLVVRRDDDHRALRRDDLVARLGDDEAHAVELVEQVVRELEVGLVDLVDEEDDALARRERAPERPELDVAADVLHVAVAEARVVEALHGVVDVEAVLRARRRLDGPVDELEARATRRWPARAASCPSPARPSRAAAARARARSRRRPRATRWSGRTGCR